MQRSNLHNKLHKGVLYNGTTGTFWRVKSTGEIDRELLPDWDFYIIYSCAFEKKSKKKKALYLAYETVHGKSVPEGFILYQKDLNENNFKLENIGCIPKKDYQSIKDALNNCNGAIKIQPHKTNVYMYTVQFKQENRTRKVTCHDIIHANRIKKIVLFKSMKALDKYIVSA